MSSTLRPGRVRRPPTIRDVAARAGVGVSTVSRVLNGGHRVSPEALRRVLSAIEELGYVSSPSARALRPGTPTRTWGLLVDEVRSSFFGTIIEELDQAAQAGGCTLLTATTQKQLTRELHLVREMTARGIDGLFIVAASGDRGPQVHADSDVPVVYLERLPQGGQTSDVVTFDYFGAVREIVSGFVSEGHRRIAFFGGQVREDPGLRRFAAYRDALTSSGLPVDDALISIDHPLDWEGEGVAYAELRQLLAGPRPPTAIVTTFDSLTLEALRAVRDSGAQVEVAGSQIFPAAFLTPTPLTLVDGNFAELASVAVAMLTARMTGVRVGAPTVRTIPLAIRRFAPDAQGVLGDRS